MIGAVARHHLAWRLGGYVARHEYHCIKIPSEHHSPTWRWHGLGLATDENSPTAVPDTDTLKIRAAVGDMHVLKLSSLPRRESGCTLEADAPMLGDHIGEIQARKITSGR